MIHILAFLSYLQYNSNNISIKHRFLKALPHNIWEDINMVEYNIDKKIALWSQMQSIVFEIDSRNHNILGFGTVIPVALTLATLVLDGEQFSSHTAMICSYALIPATLLFAMFSGAFNNKYSAILRGYIAGLEESINKDITEEVFLWNKGYSELFHGRFFLTNDAIGILYSLIAIVAPVYCFYNLFVRTNFYFLITVYLIVYAVFLVIFLYDLFSNSKSKEYAKIYFFLHHNVDDDNWKETFRQSDIRLIEKIIKKKP